MAVLALAAVGAALAPAGYAAIGWTIGSVAGQLLFPGSLPDQQGPRIGDLRVQQSQYGSTIPILYGINRVAGNVIWSTPRLETVTTQEVGGGKGGAPSQTQTTYSYRVSMAVLLGKGPLFGILRIWASGKLIYAMSAASSVSTVAASTRLAAGIEFYPGSETQLPDPTMEAWLGVGNVPAYRGLAYLVFTDLQLAPYGDSPPNITVEVVASGSITSSVTYTTPPAVVGFTNYQSIAHNGEMIVALDFGARVRLSRSFDNGLTWSAISDLGTLTGNGFAIGFFFGVWIVGESNNLAWSEDTFNWTVRTTAQGAPTQGRALASNGSLVLMIGPNATWSTSTDGRNWTSQPVPASSSWMDVTWTGTHFVAVSFTALIARSTTGLPGSWTVSAIGFGGQWNSITSNGPVVLCGEQTNPFIARSTDHGVTWSQIFPAGGGLPMIRWGNGFFVGVRGSTTNAYARSADGLAWQNFNQPTGFNMVRLMEKDGLWYSTNGAFSPNQRVTILRFDIPNPGTTLLSSVVSDICLQSGLLPGDISVGSLTDTVDGYVIGQRMSARAALETLQRAFAFDLIESNNQIVARRRGGAPVMAILADDLAASAAGDSVADDLSIVRQQEPELPADVSVVYIDRDADYQQNAQRATRVTTLSTQLTAVELAVVLTASRARAIAEMLLYDAWTQRLRFTFQLSRAYSALEPADVVTLNRGGVSRTMRITSKTESRSGVLRFEAVAEESSVYTQAAVGGAGPAAQSEVLLAPSTVWAPLDAPALRDQDSDSAFYAAGAGLSAGWRGASVFRSSDGGATYDETGAMVSEAVIGTVVGTLWNQNFHPNVFDEGTLISIELVRGVLTSAPEATVLEGANFIMIGAEVMQFKTANLYATNSYTLSGLLRGRRGTEWAMSGHAAAGERAVLLSAAALRRFPSDLGAARLYKPVSIGRTIQQTIAQPFTYTGVNQVPFAPVHLGGGRAGGDLTITWFRRSRQGVNLPWNYDPPLAETVESYDVEIWNAAFTVLRRTVASVATPTTLYTAAQQAADSGGVLASYGVRVFQRHATLGRGYVLQGVL